MGAASTLIYTLYDAGRYEDGRALAQEQFDLRLDHFGPKHRRTLWTREALANGYKYLGDYASAAEQLERSNSV